MIFEDEHEHESIKELLRHVVETLDRIAFLAEELIDIWVVRPAVRSTIYINGGIMSDDLSVGAFQATLTFEDVNGNAVPTPLSSDGSTPVVVAWSSDNESVATIDASSGAGAVLTSGEFNLNATVSDAITGDPSVGPAGESLAPPADVVTVAPLPASQSVISVTQ